ncbi:MAG: 50S ribosomal protein L25 [Planctomycetes bacterium]|nr:50S ribosomal protein L25 [Planctomycetota bacterium]
MSKEIVTLGAELRNGKGSKDAIRLRSEGRLPGVIYGGEKGAGNVSIHTDKGVTWDLLTKGVRALNIDWKSGKETVLFKDLQYDWTGTNLIHVDYVRVNLSEKISVRVPVELIGTAKGVAGGGVLYTPHLYANVICSPMDIPTSIPLKIGEMEIGSVVHLDDLKFPEGVALDEEQDPRTIVVSVIEAAKEEETATPADFTATPEVIEKGKKEDEE